MSDHITFSPDDAKGNPKAAMIRVEPVPATTYASQRAHDLRIGPQPDYVDPARVGDNRVLIQPPTTPELRRICEARRSQRETQRAMKSNARIGVRAVLGFGAEAAQIFEELSPDDQDAAILEVGHAVAAEANTTLVGAVVHNDEATVHAHFSFVGFDLDGQPLTETMRRGMTTKFQDIVAEVMGRHAPGIERGRSRWARLEAGASYAETVHKSVQELHRTLPADLEKKRMELEQAQARVDEMQKRVDETAAKLDAKGGEDTKLSKRLATYEKRLADRQCEVASIEARLSELKDEIARLAERERAVEEAEKSIAERIDAIDKREALLNAKSTRLDAQAESQDRHDADLDQRADSLDRREVILNEAEKKLEAWADQLKEKETTLSRVLSVVTKLVGAVADHLGVGASLREIRDTIVGAGIQAEDPFEDPDDDARSGLSVDGP